MDCVSTVQGIAVPADTSGPLPPPPVATSALQGLLLNVAQINAAMATTAMTVWMSFDTYTQDDVADRNCLAIDFPAVGDVYAGSGWTAMRGQQLSDPGEVAQWDHVVVQVVIAFPSSREADASFNASSQRWRACASRGFTDPRQAVQDLVWTAGPVSTVDHTLTTSKTQEGKVFWVCQRALTVANNVVVDVETCSGNPADPAALNIARQIAAKVPTQ